tara:strand:+ start:13472 stop:14851 length:1380 start_codon:yes stop_codon:yes gene_type:complete
MATTTTIYATEDANLREQYPDTNYSGNSSIRCGQYSTTIKRRHGVFKFDVSSFTAPADIVSANLYLTVSTDSGSTRTMKVVRLNQDFVEAETTWNSASSGVSWTGGGGGEGNGAFTEPNYSISIGNLQGDQEVDIKELVIDAINRRDDELWLIICFDPADTSATPTGNSAFYPSEDTTESNRPKIAVTVAERITWQGGVSGDADNALNWSSGSIPTSSDYALFNTGSVDVTDGTINCESLYVGRTYKGNIGTTSSARRMICVAGNFSSPLAGVHLQFTSLAAEVRIRDTSGSADTFTLDGLFSAIVNRTRHDITLKTENATTIDAHSASAVFTCDDDVDTLRLTGGFATFADIPTVMVLADRAFAKVSWVNNTNTSVTLASNSSVKCLASAVGAITLYQGTRITFMGNEGAPIECGEVLVYGGSILDTRTGAPTWTTNAEIIVRGGRVLMDGSRAVTVS